MWFLWFGVYLKNPINIFFFQKRFCFVEVREHDQRGAENVNFKGAGIHEAGKGGKDFGVCSSLCGYDPYHLLPGEFVCLSVNLGIRSIAFS